MSEFQATFPNDDFITKIRIFYQDNLEIDGTPISIPTKLCTFIEIQTEFLFGLEIEQAKDWVRKNSEKVIENVILRKINHLFYHIKHNKPNAILTGVLRNIGKIDLIFIVVAFEGEILLSRVTSTFTSSIQLPDNLRVAGLMGTFSVQLDLSEELKKEWLVITRSVDLINHGYYIESYVMGYALLEECMKKFYARHIPNLNTEEGHHLLQKIEKGRLKSYLGLIGKVAFGRSILEEDDISGDLGWFTGKRNKIIHDGERCTLEDAKRGLRFVHRILGKLNELEDIFDIPDSLEFW